jgi:hypothetical protein
MTLEHAGTTAAPRTESFELDEERGEESGNSPPAILQRRIADSLYPKPQLRDARWSPRSTLLLILAVGVTFWGVVFWLVFG